MIDISVLTPSYNYGHFIEDAILSVAKQADVSVEHIVQDADSSDSTKDVLKRYGDVVDWRAEPDEGQSDALNKALRRATGRWVGWLNADEFYLPDALSYLVRVADKSNADVVYGDATFVDAKGRLMRLSPQHRFSPVVLREYGCFISSNSTIFRRSVLGENAWDPGIRRMMDWDVYMKLLQKNAKFIHVVRPIGAFRFHEDQVTARPQDTFTAEDSVVSERHGRLADPEERWKASRRGRWTHPLLKLIEGAYLRQAKVGRLKGEDLRWFHDGAASQNVARLLELGSDRTERAL